MLLRHGRGHIAKGSIKCICKNQYYDNVALFSQLITSIFENFSPDPSIMGSIVGTFSVNFV